MPRIRTVKPDFFVDEDIARLSFPARLLFLGVLVIADDYGNLEAKYKEVHAQVYPHDNIDVKPLIDELIKEGRLIPYEVEGKKYWHIKGFTKHQKINRPSPPKHPKPPNVTHGALTERSLNHGVLTDHSLQERKGKERSRLLTCTESSLSFPILKSAAATRAAEKKDLTKEKIFDKITKLLRVDLSKFRSNSQWLNLPIAITEWVEAGCDLDLDIWPTVERLALAKLSNGEKLPSGPSYFTRAVLEARDNRLKLISSTPDVERVTINGLLLKKDTAYNLAISRWTNHSWVVLLGPHPSHPSFSAPPDLTEKLRSIWNPDPKTITLTEIGGSSADEIAAYKSAYLPHDTQNHSNEFVLV